MNCQSSVLQLSQARALTESERSKILNWQCVTTYVRYFCMFRSGYNFDFKWVCIFYNFGTIVFFPDRNECIENAGVCNPGQCIDTLGSYRCICPNGYKTTRDQSMCVGKLLWFLSVPACFWSHQCYPA